MATTRTRRNARSTAPVEDDAFEELDDATEAEEVEVPKTRTRKATAAKAPPAEKAPASEYNTKWLSGHITEQTGVELDGRTLRMRLRALANDGQIERTVGEDRSRYVFPKGANDPIVKALVKAVKSGDLAAPVPRGEKTEAAPKPATKRTRAKASEPVEEIEEIEDLDDEPAEEEPKPATRRRRTSTPAKAAAPAKATPSTTRRRRTASAE